MGSTLHTALRECVEILKDRQWHDVYEFHQKYHLSALQIFRAVDVLLREELIEKVGFKVRFVRELTEADLALLNRIQKSKRPSVLDLYEPKYLTRVKK